MNEKVDILLATYNGEKYIKEQIESILNQTYKNIQIIISDDCSQDGTREILEKYEKDERVRVFYQEKNLGYVKNFEFLLKQVESDIYMLSDQDDVWKEEKVEKTIEKLEQENLDLVFGDLEVVDEKLNIICKSYNQYMHLDRKIKKYINSYKLQYIYNCMTGCTMASRKEWIEKILPFPTNSKYMIHDYWMGLVIALKGKVGYIEEPYILYRQHGNNQVGVSKASHKFKKLEQLRNLSIDIKLGIFETYIENEKIFTEELKKQNKEAYEYFKMLKMKKNVNFRKWRIFYKLYKTESLLKFIENFMVLNVPCITKIVFELRYKILKLLGKRK